LASNTPLCSAYKKRSSCDGGNAYTCSNQGPWAVNESTSFGFAAVKLASQGERDWCCSCYKLVFTSGPVRGKTMVVQATNTGGDLGQNHFDLAIPGGGVGIFDGCTREFGSQFGGARFGGVNDCLRMPQSLQAGCQWRFSWFQNADNPSVSWSKVLTVPISNSETSPLHYQKGCLPSRDHR
jgi:hypothetical protein